MEADPATTNETPPPKPWWRWLLDKLLLFVVGAAVVIGVLVVFFESALIYHPSRDGNWNMRPGVDMRDCEFATEDGVQIHAWYVRARTQPSAGTLLYCHGNAGNLSHRDTLVIQLAESGMDVLIFDYRGYGKSADVSPSEEGLYRDGRAAWRYLTSELGVPASKVIVMGQSLGGAVACQLAIEVDAAGLLLICPFTRISDMARQIVPIPLGWALRHKMDNLAKVPTISEPTLVFSAGMDQVVPFRQHKRVFDAAGGAPKEFVEIDSGHNDIWFRGGSRMRQRIVEFAQASVR